VQMVCIWIVLYGPDVACHTPMSGKKVHEISVIPHTGLRDEQPLRVEALRIE
jgi:hypothetical protein